MIHHGDCLDVMAAMDPESVDAIVTDPPYGLEFMGKEWDKLGPRGRHAGNEKRMFGKGGSTRFANSPPLPTLGQSQNPKCQTCGHYKFSGTPCRCEKPVFIHRHMGREQQEFHARWAEAAYRVAKPSAYLLAFGGTRTVHRMTVALEDAGWIIRDVLAWGFASGFPKSKASLKPAYEPIVWARKPFTVPVQWWGDVHHALAALVWLIEGAPEGVGCASTRVASLFGGSDPTDTSTSRAVASTSSSIASSWAAILAALSVDGSRYTTSTATRQTTALRTLSSSLSPVISASTMPPCGCLLDGSSPSADTAVSGSSDEHTRWLATLRHSVPETAIEPIARMVAGVCAAIAADLSDDPGAVPTAHDPATTRLVADSRPIVMARKPGPLRMLAIDECRIPLTDEASPDRMQRQHAATAGMSGIGESGFKADHEQPLFNAAGRWPPNIVLTDPIFDGGIEGVVGGGETGPAGVAVRHNAGGLTFGSDKPKPPMDDMTYGDTGTYSRFFLIPKADRADREPVLGGLPVQPMHLSGGRVVNTSKGDGTGIRENRPRANVHPTVKPTDLMRHLVRLVTPTGGVVLDPFLGSGTTALAAEMEGFEWIGIEREAEYVAIAEARLNGTQRGLGLEAG